MSDKFVQGNWLLPNEINANKQSKYSLNFNGTSNIECGNISALNGATQATWSCWYRKTATGSMHFIGTWGSSSSERQFVTYQGSQGATSAMYVYMGSSIGTNRLMFQNTSNVLFNVNTWYHMAFVYNESESSNADKLKFYLDGTPITNQTTGFALTSLNTVTNGFGIGGPTALQRFTGNLDEVCVFTRALSAPEVNSLWNSGTPGNPFYLSGDPVAYYKLGETAIFQNTGNDGNIFQIPNHAQSQQAIAATNGNNFTQLVTPITQLGNTHTLSIWINSNGSTSIPVGQFFVQGSIPDYYNPYTNSANGVYITTDTANGQSLPLSSIIYRSNNNQLTASIGQLDDNNWHNLIIVRTPTAVKVYIDGGSELTLSGATLTASDTYLLRFLTGTYSAQGAAWPGIISNPAIWLSDRSSEVANIYNSGEPQSVYTTAPDYWWKLDNSTRTSIVPPTTGTTPIINYKTISSNTLTNFNSKTAIINQGYGFASGVPILFDNQINLGTQSTVSYWLLSAPFETSKPRFNLHSGGVNIFSNFSDQVGVGNYGGAYILKGPFSDVITLEVYNSTSSSEKATLTFSQANNPTEYAKIFDLNYHNWMFVRDGSNVSFYFDNVLIDSSSSLNATNNTVLKRFSGTMGTAASPTSNWGGNKFSNGVEVDEISLFNKALNSSERATLYNSGNAGNISSLSPSIWYNGDNVDFTNSKMLDLSGNSNDASLVSTSSGSSNTGLLTNFQQFLIYKEGAFAGGANGNAGLALVNTDLGLNNPLYSQFSTFFPGGSYIDTGFKIPSSYTKYSYSLWFKTTNTTTSYAALVGSTTTGNNVDCRGTVYLWGTNLRVLTGNGTVDYTSNLNVSSLLLDSNWHHIAVTFIDGEIKVFIDGSLEQTNTSSDIKIAESTTDLFIGSMGPYWILTNSFINEVAVFDRQLSNNEITSIYNNGKPTSLASHSPDQWWRLGDTGYATTTSLTSELTYPNEISGKSDGITNASMQPSINADAPKVVAPGYSSGLVQLDRKGDAPNSTSNSISYNILKTDQSVYTPKYVSQYTVDNNYSMAFEATDYFSLGSSIDLGQTNTISFWVYYPANGFHIVTGDPGISNSYNIFLNNGNSILYRTTTGYNNWFVTPTLNAWTHLVFTKNDTDTYGKLYFNGVEQPIGSGSGNIRYGVTKFNTIGAKPDGTSGFVGKLDEFAAWDKELTADQIKFDIYEASTTANKSADFINNPNLPNPVVWYRMGD
jgi:hypothetical protein